MEKYMNKDFKIEIILLAKDCFLEDGSGNIEGQVAFFDRLESGRKIMLEAKEAEVLQRLWEMGKTYETMDTRSSVKEYKNLYGGAQLTPSNEEGK